MSVFGQAHVAKLALPAVCNAMRLHPKEAEVQAKGMVVLGVLAQGEDAVHDAIRHRQLSINAHREIARSLAIYGGESDEVLWAALFSLAVLVREGGEPFEPACRAAAGINVQKVRPKPKLPMPRPKLTLALSQPISIILISNCGECSDFFDNGRKHDD
jgi:hypothetical protein